jgi:signal transduction histidine kinase
MKQIILTIDAYVALIVVLINFIFAILLAVRTSRRVTYIIFFLICFANIFWNFGDFMTFFTHHRSWFYLSLIGSGMLPALMFHWIYTFVNPQRTWTPWVIPAYASSGFLAFSSLLTFVQPSIGEFVDSVIWNILYLILLGPFIVASIILLLRAMKRAGSDDEKSMLRYILTVVIIGVSTGLSDLVQILQVPVPPLGHLGCLVYSTILGVAVFKHQEDFDLFAQMRMKLEDLSQMAAAIAHEIRNPLSSIKAASDLMAKELQGPNHSTCLEYHILITEEVERLNHILATFQDFTRPLRVEKDPVSINDLIQKTTKLIGVGGSHLEIRLELSADLPRIQADPSMMKQVFLNLIKNAAEACSPSGELVVKTESAAPWVKISFTDNGPGISPELLSRIFEPFFTTKTTGMGVGLAICQRIVEAHQGRIEANNLVPKGTQFSVFLPV